MVFSSPIFLWLFLPIAVVVNFLLKEKYSNLFLTIASLFFYAWGEPEYILLMLLSICINWIFGLLIFRNPRGTKRIFLWLCIAVNLCLLGYFKYFDFMADTINRIFGYELIGIREIALPIGISFFTFQAMSYVIDLYRGNCNVQKNIINLALYISFFPQLIAGPIVRYHDIDRQIQNRTVTREKFASGMRRFLYGLGKKVIISNCVAEIADRIFTSPASQLSTGVSWLGAVLYTLQIYYDFSGYSDMAIGLGRIFGFEFLENFNYPYLSTSIREFWQRWHISLGTWFREYVYIPLGGNRKGKPRTYLNLSIVFLLTGMWHGASWHFVIWGIYHGFFQILERLGLGKILEKRRWLGHIYTVLVFIVGWVIFRADSLSQAAAYLAHMFLPWRYSQLPSLPSLVSAHALCIIFLAVLGCGLVQLLGKKCPSLQKRWQGSLLEAAFLCCVFLYSMMQLAAGTYNPFIYFRF